MPSYSKVETLLYKCEIVLTAVFVFVTNLIFLQSEQLVACRSAADQFAGAVEGGKPQPFHQKTEREGQREMNGDSRAVTEIQNLKMHYMPRNKHLK